MWLILYFCTFHCTFHSASIFYHVDLFINKNYVIRISQKLVLLIWNPRIWRKVQDLYFKNVDTKTTRKRRQLNWYKIDPYYITAFYDQKSKSNENILGITTEEYYFLLTNNRNIMLDVKFWNCVNICCANFACNSCTNILYFLFCFLWVFSYLGWGFKSWIFGVSEEVVLIEWSIILARNFGM